LTVPLSFLFQPEAYTRVRVIAEDRSGAPRNFFLTGMRLKYIRQLTSACDQRQRKDMG